MGEVRFDREGAVAILTLDHPPVNRITAGADIRAMVVAVTDYEGEARSQYLRQWLQSVQDVLCAIERSPKIFLCAMKGIAYGGGLELAAACDIRIASREARFALPEVKIGVIPGYGGTQRIARLIGPGRATAFIVSAEPMGAATAMAAGLVDRLTDTGAAEETALKLELE